MPYVLVIINNNTPAWKYLNYMTSGQWNGNSSKIARMQFFLDHCPTNTFNHIVPLLSLLAESENFCLCNYARAKLGNGERKREAREINTQWVVKMQLLSDMKYEKYDTTRSYAAYEVSRGIWDHHSFRSVLWILRLWTGSGIVSRRERIIAEILISEEFLGDLYYFDC